MWTLRILKIGTNNPIAVYDTDANWARFFNLVATKWLTSVPLASQRLSDYRGPACQLARIGIIDRLLGGFVSHPENREVTEDEAAIETHLASNLRAII